MIKINLPFFYRLSTQLANARDTPSRQGATRLQVYSAFWDAQTILDALFRAFPHLTVSRPNANDVYAQLGRWINDFKDDLAKEDFADSPATEDYQAFNVGAAIRDLEHVLLADLQNMPTFIVTQKGIYSIQSLIDDAQLVFPPGILGKLSADVVGEIRQSGRCLAFENATASGFHMMRAVENVMHGYYLVHHHLESSGGLRQTTLAMRGGKGDAAEEVRGRSETRGTGIVGGPDPQGQG